MKQLPLGVQLRDHARFSTFVAGRNADAVANARALATGATASPAMWLWGARGTGKTHLLQASCAEAAIARRRVAYVPLGEDDVAPSVLEGLEAMDLVCADDVHRIAGDQAWERALFTLFNGLAEHAATILLSADRSPNELAFGLPDLASRLRSGPVFHLEHLADAGRMQALQLHASARGIELPDATARFLLSRGRRDMHSLSAMLETLDRASLAAQRRLTIPFVRQLLSDPQRE